MLDLQIVLIPIFWTFKPCFFLDKKLNIRFVHNTTSPCLNLKTRGYWKLKWVSVFSVCINLIVCYIVYMNELNEWSFKMICPWNVKFLKENIICLTNRTIHQSTSYRFVRNVFTLSNKRTRKRDFKFKYTRWLNPSYI